MAEKRVSNHALRHTAGTLGYLHTGDLRAVQDFLGHADPRMTAKYAHVVDMAKKNPALLIPVKVGVRGGEPQRFVANYEAEGAVLEAGMHL